MFNLITVEININSGGYGVKACIILNKLFKASFYSEGHSSINSFPILKAVICFIMPNKLFLFGFKILFN